MSDVISPQADRADQVIRASDGERDAVVALLQRHFADGRLTRGEFGERVDAALAARTRDQLGALTADLPDSGVRPGQRSTRPDAWLRCLLLWVCPPAGIIYWLLTRRGFPWG